MEYGTAEYRIKQANGHLSNFEGQFRAIPDDADPDELGRIADRIERIRAEVLNAYAYARVCRERKIEAEARVDAVIADTRRAA